MLLRVSNCSCTRRSATVGLVAAVWTLATRVWAASEEHRAFIAAAFKMKEEAARLGDQPFGAVVVKDGHVVGWGPSRVVLKNDATAHAEREAIRDAQARLGTAVLSGCTLYSTSRACSACERVAAEAQIARMYYGPEAFDAGRPRLTRVEAQ